VIDLVNELAGYGSKITVFDPWASKSEVIHEYGLEITNTLPSEKFEAVVMAVAHNQFTEMDIPALLAPAGILYDLKSVLKIPVSGRL